MWLTLTEHSTYKRQTVDRWLDRQTGRLRTLKILQQGSGESSHPPPAAQLSICHVFFISPSSSGSPAHDQISPSISRYLAADGLPACLPDQNHSLPSPPLALAAPDWGNPGYGSWGLSLNRLRRAPAQGKRPRFLLRWLALLWFINIWDINYIFIHRVRVSRFPEVKWKALGRWRKNNKWDCWGIDLGIFAYFRFCRQQMYTDLVTLNFWNGCAQWTPWQSALSCISRAEGRLEFALGWHYYMSHSCPACDVLSKFQVAKSQSRRLATGICIHLNSCSIFFFMELWALQSHDLRCTGD